MFYYTNFIVQTNTWWLRRVRPLWMGASFIYFYWIFHRYYFFGKDTTKSLKKYSEQERQRMAQLNKRNFGYGVYYQPTLQRSRKKQIMEAMGANYDRAIQSEDRFLVISTFEQLEAQLKAENDY